MINGVSVKSSFESILLLLLYFTSNSTLSKAKALKTLIKTPSHVRKKP